MQRNFSRIAEAEDEKKRAQEAAQRENEARRRRALESRRGVCTVLRFWEVCADKRCKRARGCAGDVEACFDLFWPQVPEDLKDEMRQAIVLVRDGMSPRQAMTEAREFAAQRRRIAQEMAAREAAPCAAPPPAESAPIRITRERPPTHHIGPRVRRL